MRFIDHKRKHFTEIYSQIINNGKLANKDNQNEMRRYLSHLLHTKSKS